MPTYIFICRACDYSYEEFMGLTEKHPKKCPKCKAKAPAFGQDYTQSYGSVGVVKRGIHDATEAGQCAEINAKRLGKEQMEKKVIEMQVENRKKKVLKTPEGATRKKAVAERPWWRPDTDKVLNLNKIKDVKKYVLEGKK